MKREPNAKELVELLRMRGFLINKYKDRYVLSRHSFHDPLSEKTDDRAFLDEILKTDGIGHLDGYTLFFANYCESSKMYEILFGPTYRHDGFEVVFWNWPGNAFAGFKGRYNDVGVYELDPFVARYVKTLNECGIKTEYSCDGNCSEKRMIVSGYTGVFKAIHKFICDNLLSEKFQLEWSDDCVELKFESYADFEKLNGASAFLYKNRAKIRKFIVLSTETYTSDEDETIDMVYEAMKKNKQILEALKNECSRL